MTRPAALAGHAGAAADLEAWLERYEFENAGMKIDFALGMQPWDISEKWDIPIWRVRRVVYADRREAARRAREELELERAVDRRLRDMRGPPSFTEGARYLYYVLGWLEAELQARPRAGLE